MKPLTVAKLLRLIVNVDNPHSQSHAKQIQAAPKSTPRHRALRVSKRRLKVAKTLETRLRASSLIAANRFQCGARFLRQSHGSRMQKQSNWRNYISQSIEKRITNYNNHLYPQSTSLLDLRGPGTQTRHWTVMK